MIMSSHRVCCAALVLLAGIMLLAGCGAVDAQTVRNVAEYQIRKALPMPRSHNTLDSR